MVEDESWGGAGSGFDALRGPNLLAERKEGGGDVIC